MKSVVALMVMLMAGTAHAADREVKDEHLKMLRSGETTVTQAIELLGEPTKNAKKGDGRELIYGWRLSQTNDMNEAHASGVTSGTISRTRREIVLSFGADNVLQEIVRRTHTIKDRYTSGMPQ